MTLLKSVTKKHKLAISFVLIIVLFLSFGIITIRGLNTLGNHTKTIYEHPLVVSNASLLAALNIAKMHRTMKDIVSASNPMEINTLLIDVTDGEHIVYQQLDIVKRAILGREGQVLEKHSRQLFGDWRPIRKEVVQMLNSGNREGAILVSKQKGDEHVEKLEAKILELTSYARAKADTFLNLAETSQSGLKKITSLLTLTGVLISVLIASITTYLVLKAEIVLENKRNKLQKALDEIKTLRGIIPVCSHCRQIKDDEGMWKQMEDYIHAHSLAEFSHGMCPSCMQEHYPEYYETICNEEKQFDGLSPIILNNRT